MGKLTNARFWIILEPIFLLVIIGLLARFVVGQLGLDPSAAERALQSTPPDWRALAEHDAVSLLVKWAMLIGAGWIIANMCGYRILRPIGARPPVLSYGELALFGLALSIPLYLMAVLPRWYHFEVEPLGAAPPVWDLIYNNPWTLDFWLFMAVSSFVIVPIVEEVFFRGYLLGRLNQRFPAPAAIALCGALFAIVHLQYVAADLFALYNLVAVFTVGAAYAWSVYATRSLIPAIVGHAYGNFPQPLSWARDEVWLLIPAFLILFWLGRKAGRDQS